MIDLENKKLTAKTVLLGGRKKTIGGGSGKIGNAGHSSVEKLSDSVSQVYRKWHDKLVSTVRAVMPSTDPYVVIHTENLVGLFTCVFVKSSERAKMRDIAVTTVKTGMKGRYGNKGAILARLVIDDSSICFINCHLAAGQKHVRQRNSDLIDILEEKSGFPERTTEQMKIMTTANNHGHGGLHKSKATQQAMVSTSEVYVGGGNGSSISDHEICFLQGDLNYRIDARREDVIRAIAAGEYWKLLEFDQLLKEKKFNPFFRLRSFCEPPIRFHPTYKYDPGTHMYDSSEKSRVPAWCDRILYRTPVDEATSASPPTIYIQQIPTINGGGSMQSPMARSITHHPNHQVNQPSSPARLNKMIPNGLLPRSTPTTIDRSTSSQSPLSTSSQSIKPTQQPSMTTVEKTSIVESLNYRRYEVNISDHRPISATFQIYIKSIVPGLKRLVLDQAHSKWIDYEAQVLSDSRGYYSNL